MTDRRRTLAIWKQMKPGALAQLALAVFFLFGVIGPLSALMESHVRVVPWHFILIQGFACGGMAASIVLVGRRRWWITTAVVLAWLYVIQMNSGGVNFVIDKNGTRAVFGTVTPEELTPRSRADLVLKAEDVDSIYSQRAMLGGLSIVLVVAGYVLFVRVITRELKSRVRLETEVTIARDIQQSLLPRRTIDTPFVEISGLTVPAAEVAGDLFDIVPLSDGRIALAVADVTGHGVGAGIISAMTKSALRTQIQQHPDPVAVLTNLNRTIFQVSDQRTFVTFAYALIDPAAERLQFGTAGHPPMLVRRGSSGEFESLRTVNLGLGMKEDTEFSGSDTYLRKGDRLLLYTDGIPEAANSKDEQYGIDQIRGCLAKPETSSAEVCQCILQDIKAFTGGRQPDDDMSVLCACVKQ